jgi:predicted NUDIX family NTP pyrophosphohydrolase
MKESAGVLLYRRCGSGLEVLIVHPSGNYNHHAPWSIPKGRPEPGEELEAAARRETFEETGVETVGPLTAIGATLLAKSRKRIHAFAGPAPDGVAPRCASWEVDRAAFVRIERAREMLHPAQVAFLDRLEAMLG